MNICKTNCFCITVLLHHEQKRTLHSKNNYGNNVKLFCQYEVLKTLFYLLLIYIWIFITYKLKLIQNFLIHFSNFHSYASHIRPYISSGRWWVLQVLLIHLRTLGIWELWLKFHWKTLQKIQQHNFESSCCKYQQAKG